MRIYTKNLWKPFLVIFTLLIIIVISISIYNKPERPTTKLANLTKLDKGNPVIVLSERVEKFDGGELEELPIWNGEYGPFAIDLRSCDLSNISFENYRNELEFSAFDTNTIWPIKLPSNFDPEKILETGKNPGLGINLLHKKGITGKGVSIAIIDSALFLDHDEYKDQIMLYELLHCLDKSAQMHGSLVTSIAVGKDVGVAPDAKVYYIASTFGDILESGPELDLNYMAQGILRVLEINNHLNDNEKIKVISISRSVSKEDKGYSNVFEAIEKAKEEGVFVITTTPQTNYDLYLNGLGRGVNDDPDDINSYNPGMLIEDDYFSNSDNYISSKYLMIPMDSKTYAFCTGASDYAFNRQGGLSNTSPWLAGMYALCVQVKPDITPEEFIRIAYETGSIIELQHNNKEYQFGTIINPGKIIDELEE